MNPQIRRVAFVVVASPLAKAWARRIERGTGGGSSPDVIARLERMEQAIDAIAVEIERVSEGQRFTTKLLSERTGTPAAPERTS